MCLCGVSIIHLCVCGGGGGGGGNGGGGGGGGVGGGGVGGGEHRDGEMENTVQQQHQDCWSNHWSHDDGAYKYNNR